MVSAESTKSHVTKAEPMRAGEILEACVYAGDLDAAERFYTTVLGMEVIARVPGRGAAPWVAARSSFCEPQARTIRTSR